MNFKSKLARAAFVASVLVALVCGLIPGVLMLNKRSSNNQVLNDIHSSYGYIILNYPRFIECFPQYLEVPREKLTTNIHAKYFSHMPYNEFRKEFLGGGVCGPEAAILMNDAFKSPAISMPRIEAEEDLWRIAQLRKNFWTCQPGLIIVALAMLIGLPCAVAGYFVTWFMFWFAGLLGHRLLEFQIGAMRQMEEPSNS